MVPIEFRGNIGTALQVLYNQKGLVVEQDCGAGLIPRIRSSVADSFAQSVFTIKPTPGATSNPEATNVITDSDSDMDGNNFILLGLAGALEEGTFSFSGGGGTVVSGVYVAATLNVGAPQGDCVFVGTLQTD